jgi:hypothetical protein|tara:strand:- start:1147 stop:1428 length:282 start_codon:yes stop_codon:yes gene_type:complete
MHVRKINGNHILVDGSYIGDPCMKLEICDERKKLLWDWCEVQVKFINDNKLDHVTGAFFTYRFTPTNVGAELDVGCFATGEQLSLSLVGDEEW